MVVSKALSDARRVALRVLAGGSLGVHSWAAARLDPPDAFDVLDGDELTRVGRLYGVPREFDDEYRRRCLRVVGETRVQA